MKESAANTQQDTQNANKTVMESDKHTQAKTSVEAQPKEDATTNNAKENNANHDKQKPKIKGLWFTRFIAILALFLTVSGIAVGYKTWNDVNRKANEIRDNLKLAEETLDNVPNHNDFIRLKQEATQSLQGAQQQSETQLKEIQHLAKATQHYAEGVKTQIASITHLQAQVQENAAQQSPVMATWLLSETEYLIRLANHHLQLTGKHERALKALLAADENLLRLAMPHYLPVRQQLAQDIAALENTKSPDIIGINLHIAGIIEKLKPLPSPVVSAQEELDTESKAKPESTNQEAEADIAENSAVQAQNSDERWQQMLGELQASLSKAVSIRKNGEPLKNLLDSEARHSLYELLRIRLETLRLLTLEKNNIAYQQQIQSIKSLVTEYYPASSTQAQALLQQMADLANINLEPTLPDISGSLTTFTAAQRTQPPSMAEQAIGNMTNTTGETP